jgi:hypothetical protein
MAEPLEVSNQSGQSQPDQPSFEDAFWQGSLVRLCAVDTPILGTGVLLDGQLRRLQIDLLDDQSLLAVAAKLSTTAGTTVQGMNQEMIDLLRGEQSAFVQGMARLATGFAFVLSRSQRRRGWLDDVRRGWFGRSRGVFLRGGEFLLQTSHGSLQLLDLCALLLELLLQPLAPGTGARCCFCHHHILLLACLIGHSRV